METTTKKIIKRISKAGKEYYQIAENTENETKWLPVFVSKKIENGDFAKVSTERKVDKNGQVFEIIEVKASNLFKPDDKDIYILTR